MSEKTAQAVLLLIPHFNNPQALNKSLASVGTDEPCDVLVVDDGSTRAPIDSAAAQAAYQGCGTLRILNLPQNKGIEGALNAGLAWAKARGYEWIARLDCGDENVSDRIARQLSFLEQYPDVVLLGGAASFVDQQGVEQFVLRHPTAHEDILAFMKKNSAYIHPSVIFKLSAADTVGMYPLDAPAAEDYAMFWAMAQQFKVANLPDVLIRYELDPNGISLGKRKTQLKSRLKLQKRYFDGSPAAIAGIVRTMALLAMPYELAFKIKSKLRGGKLNG
ncbi:glycosyltransferase [Chitinibacter bivalviorum]|uniref:Glycosyltransferase n=1 Tax=Chitinibacter bivalviorum TaxID=2739434 RepID=A0A7H9BJP2_9NEIS|nr:glycosyltransferase [Chitinibacter bivalviorum]QLG88793.1 glycosyltransferase [Chitinibacter bivalviorum]